MISYNEILKHTQIPCKVYRIRIFRVFTSVVGHEKFE